MLRNLIYLFKFSIISIEITNLTIIADESTSQMLDSIYTENKKQLSFFYKQLDSYELVRCQNDVRACNNCHMQAGTCSIKTLNKINFCSHVCIHCACHV